MNLNMYPLYISKENIVSIVAVLLTVAVPSAMAAFLQLSPGNAGDFTYVESPTLSAVVELRASGKRPLVEVNDFPDEAVSFTRKRLEDLELTPKEKGVLHVTMAYAYVQKKDWDHAAQMFRTARLHAPQNKREDLQTEGFVAEKRGDWATAVSCYGDEAKTYSKEEEGKKRKCVQRLNAAMAKLRGTSKENEIAPDDDFGDGALDLDE